MAHTTATGRVVQDDVEQTYPPTSEVLYLRHSKARVLVASQKQFITGYDSNELPTFSRPMDDIRDVIVPNAKRLRNQ